MCGVREQTDPRSVQSTVLGKFNRRFFKYYFLRLRYRGVGQSASFDQQTANTLQPTASQVLASEASIAAVAAAVDEERNGEGEMSLKVPFITRRR